MSYHFKYCIIKDDKISPYFEVICRKVRVPGLLEILINKGWKIRYIRVLEKSLVIDRKYHHALIESETDSRRVLLPLLPGGYIYWNGEIFKIKNFKPQGAINGLLPSKKIMKEIVMSQEPCEVYSST